MISEQRSFLNSTLMPKWASQFKDNQLVYDIGKSTTWDYRPMFKCKFKTIDRNKDLDPDILLDLDGDFYTSTLPADGIIFNGVFEQCDNPFECLRWVKNQLKPSGKVLFGLPLCAMEPYGASDKWRLTHDGAIAYVKRFTIADSHWFPTYVFFEGVLNA